MSFETWKPVGSLALATLILCAPAALVATAQPGPGRGPGTYDRAYDPARVEAVTGTITAIERRTAWRPGRVGVHLTLKTAKETLPVHLGPAWFVDALEPPLKVGEAIGVKGSRVLIGGKPALIAAEVTRGTDVVELRDASGRPVWAGWRRRTP